MPFVGSMGGAFGYGRAQVATGPSATLTAGWSTYMTGSYSTFSTGGITRKKVITDSLGNVYVLGLLDTASTLVQPYFNASGFGQSTSTVQRATLAKTTLTKYDSNGVTQWAVSFASSSSQRLGGITLDSNNNVYIAFTYQTSAGNPIVVNEWDQNGNNQVDSGLRLPGNGYLTGALIKYTPDGITDSFYCTYLGNFGTTTLSFTFENIFCVGNSLYVIGQYTIGGGTTNPPTIFIRNGDQINSSITLSPNHGYDGGFAGMIIKYSIDLTAPFYNVPLTAAWATYIPNQLSPGTDTVPRDITSFTSTTTSDIVVVGLYGTNNTTGITLQNASGNGQTPSSIILPITSSRRAGFIIVITSAGIISRATYYVPLGGTGTNTCTALSIVKDFSSTDIYVGFNYTCSTNSTDRFIKNGSATNSYTNSTIFLPATTVQGACVIKYNSSLIPQWALPIGVFGTGAVCNMGGLRVDSTNALYIVGNIDTGSTTTQFTLYNTTATDSTASSIIITSLADATRSFLLKYNINGRALCALSMIDTLATLTTSSFDSINVVGNSIYVIGTYSNSSAGSMFIRNATSTGQSNSLYTIPRANASTNLCLIKYS